MKRASEMIIRFCNASIGFDVPLTVESAFFFGRCNVPSSARGFQQPQELAFHTIEHRREETSRNTQ